MDSPNSLLEWQLGQVEERARLNVRAMTRLVEQARSSLIQHGITMSDEALVAMAASSLDMAFQYELSVEPVDDAD